MVTSLHAAEFTWSGGAVNGAWGQNANWAETPNIVFDQTLDLIFSNASAQQRNDQSLGADRIVRNISYSAAASHTLNFTSSSLTSGRNLLFLSSTGISTVKIEGTVNAVTEWKNTGSSMTNTEGRTNLANDLVIDHDGTNVFRILNDIAENSSSKVTKDGTGSLELRGNNSFSGGLEIKDGTVFINTSDSGAGGLGTGVITLNSDVASLGSTGATLFVQDPGSTNPIISNDLVLTGNGGSIVIGGSTTSFSGAVTGAGDFRKRGGGNLVFSGDYSFAGDFAVENGGGVTLGDGGNFVFDIDAPGVNNAIFQEAGIGLTSGLLLDGIFNFDLSGASATIGDSWTIITQSILGNTSFGASFAVADFTNVSGVWTDNQMGIYQFSQSTGMLSVIPEPGSALAGLLLGAGLLRRRRG